MQTNIQEKPVTMQSETGKDLPLAEVFVHLAASPEGLKQSQVEQRLEQYGYNEIAEHRTNALLKALSYLWGPIPWMIEAAALLSALVRHWTDMEIILVLLVTNAIVGFWEEYKAGNAVEALKNKLALQAQVKRDGVWKNIPARELVPGDVVRLRLGNIVPADARILEETPFEVDQSALTGESLPVTSKKGDALYSGAIIRQGEGNALVYATGQNTFFGKTAQLVSETHTTSHFQQAVLKIGNYLILLAIALVTVILGVAFYRGDSLTSTLEFALILTVAAIPVAMPTVLSVTMAVGSQLLAKKQAIVSRLSSIEELAGMDVLCSDKTGTLTQNKLKMAKPYCLAGVDSDLLIRSAALASRAENQDPIDQAILQALKEQQGLDGYEVTDFQPFDPVNKRTQATVRGPDGKVFRVAKGAPQVILALANASDEVQREVQQAIDHFAHRGYRALSVAYSTSTDKDADWQFLGVLPLFDPPRPDSKEIIAAAKASGIEVKMVTGDQVAIGKEIAGQLGLGTKILDTNSLSATKKNDDEELAKVAEGADGFAQVFPEHKYHIVKALQKHRHIVGMTGDGVNDAPALKKADAGIAVSGATDAAREAADIVLLSPGLSVIMDAVKESRRIFQRMNSYTVYRIAETIRVLLFMTLSILVFNFYPVTAVMIVLLALLNDGAILSIAYDRVEDSERPTSWDMPRVLSIATLLGIAGVIASFGLFYLGEQTFHMSRAMIQTLIYLKLSVAGHLTIFVTRTRKPFWQIRPARILLGAVIGTQAVATLIAVYGIFMTPIGWGWAALVWGYALTWFLVNDGLKVLAYRFMDHNTLARLQHRTQSVA